MDHLLPLLLAATTGFLSGLILSIPVGPVNLTVLNEGTQRGFAWAALIGIGATVMEVIYCTIAFTSFSELFQNHFFKAGIEIFSFVFMLYLGVKFLFATNVEAPAHFGAVADRLQEQVGRRLHPHSAFMIGFVRVLGNPGVLLGWVVFGTTFVIHGLMQPNWPSKIACISGVGLATGSWFICLSYGASKGQGKFSNRTKLRMEHWSGVALLLLALCNGIHIVWQAAKHKL
jgi:threonine/homoserine/homoserine lactone efflux protein